MWHSFVLITLTLLIHLINSKDMDTIKKLKELNIKSFFTDEELSILKTKRIRREMRDLSNTDWEKIYNAMNVMKFTDIDTGRERYGDKYWSYDDLVCYHGRSAYSYFGDMAHGPPHFGMWHRAYMLMFEEALLSVDSTIESFPYWDYRLDWDNPKESIIFSDKYVGSLMGDSSKNYAIKDGPFAYWPVVKARTLDNLMLNNNECSQMSNVFGLMRTRVNPNPSKYVTRIGETFCGEDRNNIGDSIEPWDSCLEQEEFTSFVSCYETSVHTGGHSGVGGTTPMYNIFKNHKVNEEELEIDDGTSCFNWMTSANMKDEDHAIFQFYGHMRYECLYCPRCDDILYDDNLMSDDIDDLADCLCSPEGDSCTIQDAGLNTDYTVENLRSKDRVHVWGDMVDAVTSVNDPIFFFHHFNMDRYTFIWQLYHYDMRPYYGYPESGYEYGINLGDIASPSVGMTNLFDEINGVPKDKNEPLTYQEIFDATTFVTAPYIYDDMWYALFETGSEAEQEALKSNDNYNSDNSENEDKTESENENVVANNGYGDYLGKFTSLILLMAGCCVVMVVALGLVLYVKKVNNRNNDLKEKYDYGSCLVELPNSKQVNQYETNYYGGF